MKRVKEDQQEGVKDEQCELPEENTSNPERYVTRVEGRDTSRLE